MKNKMICVNCGIEKDEKDYYLSKIQGQERMDNCKDCFMEEIYNTENINGVLRKYNIPFIVDLWDSMYQLHGSKSNIQLSEYMRIINSFQYKNLTWKDSILENKESKEVNFYDNIILNLRKEANYLNQKLIKHRDSNTMNDYISTLKSLKETLDLISRYDWRLMYSSYGVENEDKQLITEIAVWEQNHECQIKNHKTWKTNIPYNNNNFSRSV